jgi:hypothetical protein
MSPALTGVRRADETGRAVAAYPWPVRPFDRQHAVRGFFCDPRIGEGGGKSFHTGVDVSAPDATPVYAVAPGRVSIEGAEIVAVSSGDRDFGPPGGLHGRVDLVAEAFDRPPISAPPPWKDIPVTPALVRWRLVCNAGEVVRWRVAADFRRSFVPAVEGNSDVHFGDVYTPRTRQNHPNKPGLFCFWLARGFDTSVHPDGNYRLEVEAADVRGNASHGHLVVMFVNGQV